MLTIITCLRDLHFNSIKVQLELPDLLPPLPRSLHFNSIKVQLELELSRAKEQPVWVFQFHKGTIRTPSEPTEERLINYFNSIKVQLERESI